MIVALASATPRPFEEISSLRVDRRAVAGERLVVGCPRGLHGADDRQVERSANSQSRSSWPGTP
jgi:hypothetical protein